MRSAETCKTGINVSFPLSRAGVFFNGFWETFRAAGNNVGSPAAAKDEQDFLLTPPFMSGRNSRGVAELSLKASGAPVVALMNGGGGPARFIS